MPILQIEHGARDYDRWKNAFDSDPLGREEGGVRRHRIMRAVDDPNHVLIELEFDSESEAEAFRTRLHELWGRAQADLGLEGPTGRILDVVETKDY